MKHLRLLLVALLILVVGCTNEPSDVQFSLDSYYVTIPSEGGEVAVKVVSNHGWELRGYTSWCEPSVKSGRGSASGEVVTFSAGVADNDREVTYRFHAGSEIFELRVAQRKLAQLNAKESDYFWVLPDGGEICFEYETNMQCKVVVPDDAQGWLSGDTRALGQGRAMLQATANTSGVSREARVEVRSVEVDTMSLFFTVRQPSSYNAILYTTTDGEPLELDSAKFSSTITNNLVYDGVGIVEFDDVLIEIGEQAFYLSYDKRLKSVILPDMVEVIGSSAFYESERLETITLPSSLHTIGTGAFAECGLLTEVTIPDGVTTIGDGAFRACSRLRWVTMTDSVTSLGALCFDGCEALEEVRLSDSIIAIQDSTFYGCVALRKVNIPASVEVIGCYSFCGCVVMEDIKLPEGLHSLGRYAFMSCHELTNIDIPEGVTLIDDSGFGDCPKLTRVTLPESLTMLGSNAFVECTSLRTINIPKGITELSSGVFVGCQSLNDVVLPDRLKVVGSSAFAGCESLTTIDIPATVTHINDSAFAYCYSLERAVVRNESLRQIQSYAFAHCYALDRLELYALQPPQLSESNIFDGCSDSLRVGVPAESLDEYRTSSEWRVYADMIEAL